MRIAVDMAVCKAYANCMVESPEYFDFSDETGKVAVLTDEVAAADEESVRRAVAACPVHAISLVD